MQEALSLESEALWRSQADWEDHLSQVEAACLEGWRLAWAQAYRVERKEQGWHLVAQEVYQVSLKSACQKLPRGWEVLEVELSGSVSTGNSRRLRPCRRLCPWTRRRCGAPRRSGRPIRRRWTRPAWKDGA